MLTQHREIREGDEIYCVTCGKRWGVRETPPNCFSRREKGLNQISELRKRHGFKKNKG